MPALDKPAPAPTKRCSKCAEVKPLTEFNRHPSTRDGRRPECRECDRAAARHRARARIASGRAAAAKRALRERYIAQGLCKHGPGHGPATHGIYCAACARRYNVAKYRRIMIEFATAMDDLGIDIDTLCPCGQEEVAHVDHILPDSLDGPDDFENLRYLGAFCNLSKGNRTDWEPATSWLDAPQWHEPPNAFTTE